MILVKIYKDANTDVVRIDDLTSYSVLADVYADGMLIYKRKEIKPDKPLLSQDNISLKKGDKVLIDYPAITTGAIYADDVILLPETAVIAVCQKNRWKSVNGWVVGISQDQGQFREISFQTETDHYLEVVMPSMRVYWLYDIDRRKKKEPYPDIMPEIGDKILVNVRQVQVLSFVGMEILGHTDLVAIQKQFIYGYCRNKNLKHGR